MIIVTATSLWSSLLYYLNLEKSFLLQVKNVLTNIFFSISEHVVQNRQLGSDLLRFLNPFTISPIPTLPTFFP